MDRVVDNIPKRITIMGLGLFGGGVGAATYWAQRGAEVTVTDLRDAQTLAPSIAQLSEYKINYVLEKHNESDFSKCDLLIVNPAVKPHNKYVELAIAAGVAVTTEIGLFIKHHAAEQKNPILAVTGSNGKSTTTALLSSILTSNNRHTLSGGNIGGSLLSKLNKYPSNTPAVLELSSFQLHYLLPECFAPDISIITNLAPNHLDWHGKLEDYYKDKQNIIKFQNSVQHTILNYEDQILREWAEQTTARIVFTSLKDSKQENAAFISNNNFMLRYNGEIQKLAPLSALQLPGSHNQENALQSLTAAYIFCRDRQAAAKGLEKFKGLPHRQEIVAESNRVTFINDSIATTPQSTIAALNSYTDKDITIIAGGYDKDIPLQQMSAAIVDRAKSAILIGQTSSKIYQQIKALAPDFNAEVISDNFNDAVRAAYNNTKEGIILLSPGCASYGMFTNFQQRGESFTQISQTLLSSN